MRRNRFRTDRRRRRPAALWRILMLGGIAFTAWQWGHAVLIHAKARLAPILIQRAWAASRARQTVVKPWPWADTWPVARLTVPSLAVEQYVLAGTNGAALPFGPGHLTGSATPGQPGTIVIAGHRDTHFAFLPRLAPGVRVALEATDGARSTFVVAEKALVDARAARLQIHHAGRELILVTCEPGHGFSARGPYRLIVTAI